MVGKSTMVGIRAAPLAIEWISRSRGMPPAIRHSAQFAKVQSLYGANFIYSPLLYNLLPDISKSRTGDTDSDGNLTVPGLWHGWQSSIAVIEVQRKRLLPQGDSLLKGWPYGGGRWPGCLTLRSVVRLGQAEGARERGGRGGREGKKQLRGPSPT